MDHVDRFRKHATESLKKADLATNALEKEDWRKIAEHWLLLAVEAEENPSVF
jgi:hypothetical protein